MATIPENQERIYLVLKDMEQKITALPVALMNDLQADLDTIRAYVANCNRRKPKQIAPIQSDPMDYAKRIQILQTRQAHPDWTQQKIGAHCNVIAGRVSEVLRGKRK